MIGLTLICLSLSALVFGTVVHFWILGRLESAGVRVKYFANVWDNFRAYKVYRDLAQAERWPLWPSYAVLAVYLGVLFAGLSLFFDSPLLRIARWLK
jgi:hypothetical protein